MTAHPTGWNTPYLTDTDFTLYCGDALQVLRELPAGSVDCCVTSPPYWGLRDYGVDQQLGLEQTPDEYVARMVDVFREVRRVLTDAGTVFLNLGDSYAGHNLPGGRPGNEQKNQGVSNKNGVGYVPGLKPKDLCGIPWRVAFALQADGWYLRSDIIWAKPNPMPESVTDRPTKAHEYVFLLSKSPRYWFDQEAVREPAEWARWGDQTNGKHEGSGSAAGWIGSKSKAELQRPQARRAVELFEQAGLTEAHARAIRAVGITDTGKATVTQDGTGKNDPDVQRLADEAKEALGGYYREFLIPNGRNIRSVWEIATQPFPEAHFAVFPEGLPRRCISAGCPERVCRTCGKPSERIFEKTATGKVRERSKAGLGVAASREPHGLKAVGGVFQEGVVRETLGWSDCGHDNYRPGVVLDPFMGSGTTALVARRLGRHSVGIELNPEYCRLAAQRTQQLGLLAEHG